MNQRRIVMIFSLVVCIILSGCLMAGPQAQMPQTASPRSTALIQAAEQFYAATTVADMRAAVETASKEGPDSCLYHEIAAELARFEDRKEDEFNHLKAALLDPSNETALMYLHRIYFIDWNFSRFNQSIELFETLAKGHPDMNIRRVAAYYAMRCYKLGGKINKVAQIREELGYQPALSVIGPFDNDQGKGFDIPYPPEKAVDSKATYQGVTVPVSWRHNPPRRMFGDFDMDEMMYPYKYAVAYAAAALEVSHEGAWELRLNIGGPVKIWVNDIEIYSDRHINSDRFDSIVLPVTFRKGVNRILIKSANKKGGWIFGMYISAPGGMPVSPGDFKELPIDTPYAVSGPSPGSTTSAIDAIMAQWPKGLDLASARGMHYNYLQFKNREMKVPVTKFAEVFAQQFSGGIIPRYKLAMALWNNNERGRTSDILNKLYDETGTEFPLIAVKQARFLRQGKLTKKARAILESSCKSYPDRSTACSKLAIVYDKKDWNADRLKILEALHERFPEQIEIMDDLADCYTDMKRYDDAKRLHNSVLQRLPNRFPQMKAIYYRHLNENNLPEARQYAERLTRAFNYYSISWRYLGDVLQRQGDMAGAEKAYTHMTELCPSCASGFNRLGKMYYQNGETEKAIESWSRALENNPDDEDLANRLNHLSPPKWGPWAGDVPDEQRMAEVVKSRENMTFSSDANVAFLLDHSVYELKADGSSTSVTTFIAHALNKQGRDRLTKQPMPKGGRIRVLHAYSVDPKGNVHEASSIRGREIRFRKLKTGSTTVIQYQHDASPSEYLSGYFSQQWWFQAFYVQYVDSEYILWAPKDIKVSEFVRGEKIARTEDVHNTMKRYAWHTQNVPIPQVESGSPPPEEFTWKLSLTTVPDWSMFQKWEKALLEDAFRTSPELEKVTEEILDGTKNPMEKLYAIQEYLEQDIRYQMDYEHKIAGVKPHAAPMVLARRYGDCKDKAVLFITMAKIAGIKARFALVRTFGRGPVLRELPMQQFNHAIVYVPAQEGIANGRFFDPTVSDLDVQVLRADDQGTWAFVLSDDHENYEWIKVTYQKPDLNNIVQTVSLALNKDGSASASMKLESQGMIAMLVRSVAHNPKQFEKMVQILGNKFLPGARVTEHEAGDPKDLRKPFTFGIKASVPAIALREGRQLRMTVPIDWNPGDLLKTNERVHDYVFPTRISQRWAYTITPPDGGKVERLPKDYQTDNKYLWFARRSTRKGNSVLVEIEVAILQPRIPVKEFPKLRPEIENILRMMREEVVFKVAK